MSDVRRQPEKSARPSARKSRTGVPGLDSVMAGATHRRTCSSSRATPGPGKTTLALQFLLEGVRQGEKGLYVTLSESAEELRLVAQSHGWSLDGIEIFELMPDEEALSPMPSTPYFIPPKSS